MKIITYKIVLENGTIIEQIYPYSIRWLAREYLEEKYSCIIPLLNIKIRKYCNELEYCFAIAWEKTVREFYDFPN